MEKVVDKFTKELAEQLADREVTISLTPAARIYLAEKGYGQGAGRAPARPSDPGRSEAPSSATTYSSETSSTVGT